MIKLSQATLDQNEKDALCRVIDNLYLGMGSETKAFEFELKQFIDPIAPPEVVCVNTGTSALHLAVQALGIGPGDEVIVPTLTYVASFQAISATGATPVAADVDPITGCLCPIDAQKRITSNTKALMPVHYASGYGALHDIYEVAHQHNLRVIEDAAHSFGGFYNGKRIGATGDIICFSFDGIKNLTCGEGGAVVSRDKNVTDKIADLRLLAVSNDTKKRYVGQRSFDLEVYEQGWRYHMSNLNAAIGRSQLLKIDFFGERRRYLHGLYKQHIPHHLIKPFLMDAQNCIPHALIMTIETIHNNPTAAKKQRDELITFLKEHEIETGLHYKPNHLLSYYSKDNIAPFPIAEDLWNRMITIPLHSNLSDEDVLCISEKITSFFK